MAPGRVADSKNGGRMARQISNEHKYLTRSKGSMKEIEEATQALELLTCEFVDPDEELYLQERSLKHMPGFGSLSTELRIMIWKATFPAGHLLPINLESFFLLLRPPKKNSCKLPVSLHINHESRQETKRHYYVLLPDEAPPMDPDFKPKNMVPSCLRKTLCIDMERDFVYQEEGNFSWAEELSDLIPGVWDRLKHLVLRLGGLEDLEVTEDGIACYPNVKQLVIIQPDMPTTWLPGLPSLAQEHQRWMYGVWPQDAEDSKTKLLSMMEERKLKDPGRTIPEITMLPYQRLQKSIWWS